MNVSLTLIGQFILVFAVINTLVCYYLGRRKVETPVLAAVLGFVFSIVPIFGLLYTVLLMFKEDLGGRRESRA